MLDKAVEAIRRMPPIERDTIAQAMLSMDKIGERAASIPGTLGDVLEGLAEIEHGNQGRDPFHSKANILMPSA